MNFKTIQELREFGFEGFVAVADLMRNPQIIPRQMGIYVSINTLEKVSFLERSVGGHFKGKDPTLSVEDLKKNWVENALVLYFGKAGGAGSTATLQSRLKQYMQFGEGKPIGHWGGRLIWQLADNRDLIVAWKPLSDQEPREVEKQLIAQFEDSYGKKPFANLAG